MFSQCTQQLSSIQRRVERATVEAHSNGKTPILENVDQDEDESYRLGVDLFGAEAKVVAQNEQTKLSALEEEVDTLVKRVKQRKDGDGGDEELYTTQDMTDENASDNSNNNDIASLSASQILTECQYLYGNLLFLQACSAARASLDDSVTLATPELAPQMETQPVRSAELLVQAAASLRRAETILEKAGVAATAETNGSDRSSGSKQSQKQQKRLLFAYDIIDSIQDPLRRHKLDLIRTATKTLHDHISTIDTVTHRFSVRRGTAEHGKAFDVLQVLAKEEELVTQSSTLERVLHDICRQLYRDVLQPILQSHRDGCPVLVAALSHPSAPLHRWSKKVVQEFEWSWDESRHAADETMTMCPAADPTASITAWSSTFRFLQQVLEFTAEFVLLGRKELCSMVGRKLLGDPRQPRRDPVADAENLWKVHDDMAHLQENGSLMDPLMLALEETCIPPLLQPSELHRLKDAAGQLQAILQPFLSLVQTRGFATEGLERLSSFPGSFEAKYVYNRQCLHLCEARSILLESDYHSTVQVGEDPPESDCKLPIEEDEAVFLLHRSSISITAFRIMQKCRSILDEAVALPKYTPVDDYDGPLYTMSMKLRGTAREVLDLYRSIIPVTFGEDIAKVPRAAAILHNDCVFFSHHCLALGMEYGEKASESITDEGGDEEDDGKDGKESRVRLVNFFFADMVPLFRKLAEQSMCNMLDELARQIMAKVDVSSLSSTLEAASFVSAWSEAETAVDMGIRQLQQLSKTWTPVLAANIRHKSLSFLSDVVMGFVLEQVISAPTMSPAAVEFLQALFQKIQDVLSGSILAAKSRRRRRPKPSHIWSKFAAVHRVLQRHAIVVGLSEGVFESLTTEELCGLVKAVFEDEPQRQRLLERLDGTKNKNRKATAPSIADEGGKA